MVYDTYIDITILQKSKISDTRINHNNFKGEIYMKKFISVVLLLGIIISCFTITSFAGCSHNGRYVAQQSYNYYDSICHVIRIKYACANCGAVVNIEKHKQVHYDNNNDGYCDYCRSGSSSSSSSSSSNVSTGSVILDGISEVLGFIIAVPLYIISLPFNLIAFIFGF